MVIRGLKDLNMVRRLMTSAKGSLEARAIKEEAEKAGFEFAMSLYGVLTNKETNRSEYRRIEILADNNLTTTDIELLYRWFYRSHPINTYSVWLYHTETQQLLKVFDTW